MSDLIYEFQDLDSSGDAYQLTYDPFVSTSEEIKDYLDGEFLNSENDIAFLKENAGIIQRILATALEENSVSFEDEFHVFLDNKGRLDRRVDRVKPWFIVHGLAHGS